MLTAWYRRQYHSVSVERYHKFAAIFAAILIATASLARFIGVVGDGFNSLFKNEIKMFNVEFSSKEYLFRDRAVHKLFQLPIVMV